MRARLRAFFDATIASLAWVWLAWFMVRLFRDQLRVRRAARDLEESAGHAVNDATRLMLGTPRSSDDRTAPPPWTRP